MLRSSTSARLLAVVLLAGCAKKPPPPAAPPPPPVTVAKPTEETIIDYRDFTGRTAAIDSVTVRARVTGYLQEVHFQEGAEVQAGDLLYQIDPRPYEAALAQAEGNVAASEALRERQQADVERSQTLLQDQVISREEFDRTASELAGTVGTLQSLRAGVERARLDLEFTRVRAPLSGLTGKSELDVGNLIVADVTALTSIVSIDPIHAWFDVDERSVLFYRDRIRAKEVESARDTDIKVLLGLADEDGYPHEGVIDFVDNQLDPTSGTIRLRAVFPNPDRLISPGFFVRIRVPFSHPHPALLVDERALASDQRGWYVYVVDAEGTVQQRPVVIGDSRGDGRVVVVDGIGPGEQVIVVGAQRARPGGKVEAHPAEAEKPPGSPAPAPAGG